MVFPESMGHTEYLIHFRKSILGAAVIRQTMFLDAKRGQTPMNTLILWVTVPFGQNIQVICAKLIGARGRGKP